VDDGRRWAIETFGAHGVHIRDTVSQLVREEHTASADAQEASGHRSRGVYGQFWRGILERFEQFGQLPGSALIRPGQAPYRIPVVSGVAIFPWRYGGRREGDLSALPFLTSEARAAMFDLSDLEIQQEFDLGLTRPELTAEEEELADIVEQAIRDELVSSGKLVVVAISSSVNGLYDMTWGDVSLGEDGCIRFGFHESLMGLKPPKPFAVADESQTFTTGEPPAKDLGLQGQDEDELDVDDPNDV
jgi:hypothetical protein